MLQLLGTFLLISLTGALSPGPLTTMAVVEGPRRGKWSGGWLALGHGVVEAPYMGLIAIVAWLGRETVLRQPIVAGLIAVVGGGFMTWMGWGMGWGAWRHQLTLDGTAGAEARFGLVSTGALMSVSNPYWWVWWALITPLYIQQSFAWGVLGVAILFLVHWSSDLGWLTAISWLTGSGRKLINPGIYRWILVACGLALLFFGITFIIAGVGFLASGEVNLT